MEKGFAHSFPHRILIAEDNLINRQLILHILGNLGYEPDCVENGEQAVVAAGQRDYDLILMDVQMPEMDGLEATRLIRRRPAPQPVVIALTANAMRGDKEECLQAGMNDYISKPVRLDELIRHRQRRRHRVDRGRSDRSPRVRTRPRRDGRARDRRGVHRERARRRGRRRRRISKRDKRPDE